MRWSRNVFGTQYPGHTSIVPRTAVKAHERPEPEQCRGRCIVIVEALHTLQPEEPTSAAPTRRDGAAEGEAEYFANTSLSYSSPKPNRPIQSGREARPNHSPRVRPLDRRCGNRLRRTQIERVGRTSCPPTGLECTAVRLFGLQKTSSRAPRLHGLYFRSWALLSAAWPLRFRLLH